LGRKVLTIAGAVTGTVVAAVGEGGTTGASCVQIHACVKGVLLQTQNKKGIKVSGTYSQTPVRPL
jgi:hypothetical protein